MQQQLAQRVLAGVSPDQVFPERLEDRLERDQVLLAVVDEEDVCASVVAAHVVRSAAGSTQSP